MKTETHPEYHSDAVISCVCGKNYKIGSTIKEVSVELCANCHPFYTGKQKLVDTAGRVDKFKKKVELKSTKTVAKGRKAKREKQAATKLTKVKADKTIKKSSK